MVFSIFKNIDDFIIKEKRIETCLICNKIKEYVITNHYIFITINKEKIKLNNIAKMLNSS